MPVNDPKAAAPGGNPRTLTVEAIEQDTPEGKEMAFDLKGTPTLRPGDKVRLLFHNKAQHHHNVHVTTGIKATDQHRNTAASDAIAQTRTLDQGEDDETVFTVPEADHLYLWCDEDHHEDKGMWAELPIERNT